MKIAFVLDDSLDSTDGVQQYVKSLGSWMSIQGHEVHFLVGETKTYNAKNIHSLAKNISVRFNGNKMTMPLPASRKRIRQLLASEKYDVLHVQMPYSPFLAAKIIKAAPSSTSIVGTFHILPYGSFQKIATRVLTWWTRSSLLRFDTIFSVSKPAQLFATSLGIESTIMPNVIDVASFRSGKPKPQYQNCFTIVFLGRLVERKGAKELLQAFRQFEGQHQNENIKLVICGKGSELETLKSYAERHGLNTDFTGFISEEEKADYLASADLAVFPSKSGESFGIVLLEAMAARAGVVIGGDNPGYSSVLYPFEHTLFQPTNIQDFVAVLERFYSSNQDREIIHQAQQKFVEQFDVSIIGAKIVSKYKQLLHKT